VLAPFFRSPGAVRLSVGLKMTRTGQLLGRMVRAVRDASATPEDWGGMAMFLEQAIPLDDPRLDAVRASFAANLDAIAANARDTGARTLLCTVATNLKDFAPFLSRHRTDLSADDLARWEDAFAAASTAAVAGDWPQAEEHYRDALALDHLHAETAFRLGRIALARDQNGLAASLLQQALDTDALRFRTDSSLNGVIRDVAAARPEDTELVDLAVELGATSPHGILGNEVLYEHVHLTFRGTWEAARILFDRVSADLARRGLVPQAVAAPLSYEEARTRLAYTTYEQAMIIHELRQRFARPPFTGQSDHAARIAAWEQRAAAADELLQRPESRAAFVSIYEQAIAAAPGDWVLRRNYGMMLVATGAPDRALAPLEQARAVIDDDPDLLFALGTAQRATHREAAARETFQRLRELEPRYPGLPK
jgi:tetratricopeptide (TPR) repeat protein